MKRCYLLIFLFLWLSNLSQAQITMGFNFNYTQPLKDYDRNLEKDPKGFSFILFAPLQKLEGIKVGAEVGVSMYANEQYSMQLVNSTGSEEVYLVDEEDCFFRYNALMRYFPVRAKIVNPYLEAAVGGVSFFSTQSLSDELTDFYETKTKFHGTALNLAIGTGVIIKLADHFAVDMRVQANSGTNTFYRSVESSEEDLKRNLNYGRSQSATDHINYSLGITFGF